MTDASQIAKAVYEWLRTLDLSIAAELTYPATVPILNRTVPTATLQVYPFEEDEEIIDRADTCQASRWVAIVLQRPVDEQFTRDDGIRWLNEVKEQFRDTYHPFPDGEWKWRRNSTISLYDFEALKERLQFLSLFRAEFYNFC